MNIEYLANLAEITSGILVVVTLIFLVIQIRDNTKALRNSAKDNFYNAYLETTADANRVPEVAAVLNKAFADQPMDDPEKGHFASYIQRTCGVVERGLLMVNDGVLDEETFDLGTPPAKMILATPAGRHWYYFLKDKRGLFHPELHNYLENFYRELDVEAARESEAEANAVDSEGQARS